MKAVHNETSCTCTWMLVCKDSDEFSGELWPPMAPENDGLPFLSVVEATLLCEHFMDSGIGRCG